MVTVPDIANGAAGAKCISPYVNSAYVSEYPAYIGANYQITCSDTTALQIHWGTGGPIANKGSWFQFNGADDLKAITNAHRIVSACMIVQPEASSLHNEGEICLFSVPFAGIENNVYADYMNHYKSVVVPCNTNKPSVVRWYPISRQDWNFKAFQRTDGTALSYDDAVEQDSCPAWEFGFVTSGMAGGTVIRYTIVVNYEFVPTLNTLNVLDASPSPNDVMEMDLVESWVQDMPVAKPISVTAASSSPSGVQPRHEDDNTGFGMFFNVLTELAPLALAML